MGVRAREEEEEGESCELAAQGWFVDVEDHVEGTEGAVSMWDVSGADLE